MVWGVTGNVVGSLLGYAAARWGGQSLPQHCRENASIDRAGALLDRHSAPLVTVNRTPGSLRTPVTVLCGLTRFPLTAYLALR